MNITNSAANKKWKPVVVVLVAVALVVGAVIFSTKTVGPRDGQAKWMAYAAPRVAEQACGISMPMGSEIELTTTSGLKLGGCSTVLGRGTYGLMGGTTSGTGDVTRFKVVAALNGYLLDSDPCAFALESMAHPGWYVAADTSANGMVQLASKQYLENGMQGPRPNFKLKGSSLSSVEIEFAHSATNMNFVYLASSPWPTRSWWQTCTTEGFSKQLLYSPSQKSVFAVKILSATASISGFWKESFGARVCFQVVQAESTSVSRSSFAAWASCDTGRVGSAVFTSAKEGSFRWFNNPTRVHTFVTDSGNGEVAQKMTWDNTPGRDWIRVAQCDCVVDVCSQS